MEVQTFWKLLLISLVSLDSFIARTDSNIVFPSDIVEDEDNSTQVNSGFHDNGKVATALCQDGLSCVPLADCPSVLTLSQQAENPDQLQIIRDALRSQLELLQCDDGYCCQDAIKKVGQVEEQEEGNELNLKPLSEICGQTSVLSTEKVAPGGSADGRGDPPGSWPWMASIGYRNRNKLWFHKCGGTVITRRHILTAAHCNIRRQLWARVGSPYLDNNDYLGYEVIIRRFQAHPEYERPQAYYDVALSHLQEPLNFDDFVRPICLPSTILPVDYNQGKSVTLTGWGLDSLNSHRGTAPELTRTEIVIFSQGYCNRSHTVGQDSLVSEKIRQAVPRLFTDEIVCAGHPVDETGSCVGDSGGPISYFDTSSRTLKHVQAGVVSSGVSKCGDTNFPGIYVRIPSESVLKFIVFDTEIDYVSLPVHGSWSDWSPFSECSSTCGPGMHSRTRECDDPAPQFRGRECEGPSVEQKECINFECLNKEEQEKINGDLIIKGRICSSEGIEDLLNRGAQVNYQNWYLSTTLMEAAKFGRENCTCLAVLIARGAELERRDRTGATALLQAASSGQTECLKILLKHGANADAETSQGETALHLASKYGHLVTVKHLLEQVGVETDVNNIFGKTPLMLAEEEQEWHTEVDRRKLKAVAEYLKSKGVDN